jgi:hypothetical protein
MLDRQNDVDVLYNRLRIGFGDQQQLTLYSKDEIKMMRETVSKVEKTKKILDDAPD